MSGRVYWLSIVLVLCISTAVWWSMLTWLGVSDPWPGVAVIDVMVLTAHLGFIRWLLKDDDSSQNPNSHA